MQAPKWRKVGQVGQSGKDFRSQAIKHLTNQAKVARLRQRELDPLKLLVKAYGEGAPGRGKRQNTDAQKIALKSKEKKQQSAG